MGYSLERFMCAFMNTRLPAPQSLVLTQVLRTARLAAGLRQADLARRLQKPQSFVSKIETGERSLNIVEFAIIARAIGTDPLALFEAILATMPLDACV
jgi:transcriptional regulator with XRE-family HTH domain